jgi:DTW domain-containing protein
LTSKRQICATCLRPKITCICHLVSTVPTDIEVLILQHPLEVSETKGTVRLLHLSLTNSRILIGEVFAEDLLHSTKNALLLYPTSPEDHSLGISAPAVFDSVWLKDLKNIQLIIIDGTWRKSRKILCKNPYLQTLPRLPLTNLPAGQYTIRKARKPHQLSTFEAAIAALAQLEKNIAKFVQLEQSFIAFNAMLTAQLKRQTPNTKHQINHICTK